MCDDEIENNQDTHESIDSKNSKSVNEFNQADVDKKFATMSTVDSFQFGLLATLMNGMSDEVDEDDLITVIKQVIIDSFGDEIKYSTPVIKEKILANFQKNIGFSKKVTKAFSKAFAELEEIKESRISEGHDGEIGPTDAQTKDAAIKELEDMIKFAKENDGDLKKFRGVKWVGNTTEDKLDRLSMQHEDQYIVAGIVDGEIWMARSKRS